MKNDLLLEIGCENLPSGYIDDALRQLEQAFAAGLKELRLGREEITVEGTPRRLVVRVRGLDARQAAARETVTGPPLSAALDAGGAYTPAALGFARRQGVPAERLERVETERGEYLAVVTAVPGRAARPLLQEHLPAWISDLRFAKTMRWDASGLRFARPIRWVLAFLGDRPLKFRLGLLRSAPFTRLSPYYEERVPVEGIESYDAILRRAGIVLDRRVRFERIRRLARRAARRAGGGLVEDERLCAQISNLVESPVVMSGSFDAGFLELPREVVVTALRSHQRYFSVEGENGALLPRFVAFADGARRNRAGIARGYERVLQARLADARFYYREDTALPLERMAHRLDGIVWLEGLGTLADKARRTGALAAWIARAWRPGDDALAGLTERAALLAKADLASEMVKDGKEFTLLQGYIGREYALLSGESDEVAEGIYEHYLPRFAGDRLPLTGTGTVLALADRFDTICGCFLQGFEPTGSQDPYALRRGALGILRILMERGVPLDLPAAVRRALEAFDCAAARSGRSAAQIEALVMDLFAQRLTTILRGGGYDYDLVAALLSAPWRFPGGVAGMARRLQDMRAAGELQGFVLALRRVVNILPKQQRSPVEPCAGSAALAEISGGKPVSFSTALFCEAAEDELLREAQAAAGRLAGLGAGDIERSIDILARLAAPVNRYFEAVLVNCEDRALRENRLAFLLALSRMAGYFCHFPAIVVDQGEAK